jgi:hypothetical protein
MKIGFFGDSFVAEMSNPHSWYYKYDTFLKRIKDHYSAEIVNLGVGGSSYWDVMLKQFPPYENNLPDVCVFCWTDFSRVYHPTVRNIGSWTTLKHNWKDLHYSHFWNRKEINAGKEYFTHLYDHEKAQQESIASFYHYDREVLAPLQYKTKIIHLWSFGVPKPCNQEDPHYPNNINYIYRWQTGTEIRPSLKCFSTVGRNTTDDGMVPNHLGSTLNNKLVADMIIEAIDNHANGQLLVKDAMWEQSQINPSVN